MANHPLLKKPYVDKTPKCPNCGLPARGVNCSQCGSPVRDYKTVKKETDKEKFIGEEKDDDD